MSEQPFQEDFDVPDLDDDETLEPVTEPRQAARSSPYAIAAFVIAVVTFWQAPSVLTFPGGWGPTLVTLVSPAAAAVLVRWLAARAEEEVYVSAGRLGGVGLYRAANLLALLILVFIGLQVLFLVVETQLLGFGFDL